MATPAFPASQDHLIASVLNVWHYTKTPTIGLLMKIIKSRSPECLCLAPILCSILLGTTPLAAQPSYKVLVFSATAGFRHDSIPDGIAAIQQLGTTNNFVMDATEDPTRFTDTNLSQYRAIVSLNTTGNVLTNSAQREALQSFVRNGGGWAGIHSAADTLYDWPWYGGLVGAYFASHPAIQTATIKVADRVDPSTRMLHNDRRCC